jgi:hypothetical protein
VRGATRTRSRHLILAVLALIVAMGSWLAMVQAAEASWSGVYRLSPRGWEGQDSPSLAIDGNGNTLLAWVAYKSSSDGALFQVQTRIRSHTGRMGRIRPLSPLRADESWPKAAADATGDKAVIWANGGQLQGRRLSASGSIGRLRVLSRPGTAAVTWGVVMGSSGAALAVWWQLRNGNEQLVARYFHKNGSLGPVMTLGAGTAVWPTVAINRLGTATVAWTGSDGRLVARRVRPGKVSPVRVIMPAAPSTAYSAGSIAEDARGDSVLAFTRSGNSQPMYLMVRVWRSSGKLGRARSIARNDETLYSDVAVATGGRGASIVAWTHYNSSIQSDVAFGRRVSLTGVLGRVVRLGTGYAPVTSIDPAGAGMVAWQSTPLPLPGSTGNGLTHVHARRFSAAAGTFGRKFTLAPDGDSVRLGESRTEKIAAIWQQSTLPWPIHARFGP